eukprot:2647858-Rhodomonas_salina.1
MSTHGSGNSSVGLQSASFSAPVSHMQSVSAVEAATECDPTGHGRHVTSRPVPHRYSSTRQSAYA